MSREATGDHYTTSFSCPLIMTDVMIFTVRTFQHSLLITSYTMLQFNSISVSTCIQISSDIFLRRYGTRCARCGRNIHSNDWVRRARGSTFHLACFSCTSCKRQLSTGEECGFLENRVFCRPHYDIVVENIKRAKENGEHRDGKKTVWGATCIHIAMCTQYKSVNL